MVNLGIYYEDVGNTLTGGWDVIHRTVWGLRGSKINTSFNPWKAITGNVRGQFSDLILSVGDCVRL